MALELVRELGTANGHRGAFGIYPEPQVRFALLAQRLGHMALHQQIDFPQQKAALFNSPSFLARPAVNLNRKRIAVFGIPTDIPSIDLNVIWFYFDRLHYRGVEHFNKLTQLPSANHLWVALNHHAYHWYDLLEHSKKRYRKYKTLSTNIRRTDLRKNFIKI